MYYYLPIAMVGCAAEHLKFDPVGDLIILMREIGSHSYSVSGLKEGEN